MPLYKTLTDADVDIGIYSSQRPSTAACKAFTVLRRKNFTLNECKIKVCTEGRKDVIVYTVTYTDVQDAFLGALKRPIAVKSED